MRGRAAAYVFHRAGFISRASDGRAGFTVSRRSRCPLRTASLGRRSAQWRAHRAHRAAQRRRR